MAERLIVPGTAPAKSEATTSPILAIHRRYEAAWEEYNRIDTASTALDKNDADDHALGCRYQAGKEANNAETDALRQAILYQVPTTWPEAMVLLYHIHVAFDLTDKPSPEEHSATETALNTLFDFMCCEVEQDHEALGKFLPDQRQHRIRQAPVSHRHCGGLSRDGPRNQWRGFGPSTFDLADTVGKKVVRLPTAQPRQVKQPYNKAGREARLRLRNEQRRHFDYVFPCLREAKRKIAELQAMPPTAAVSFLRNIIDAHSGDDSRRALDIIRVGVAAGDPVALEVEALMKKVAGTTVGEQSDFLWARARMAEEVQ